MSACLNAQICHDLPEALRQIGSAKSVARLADTSPRTVERWQRGEATPNGVMVLRLMARSRAFAQAALRIAGLDDAALDAEEARLLADLKALHARQSALKEALHEARQ